MIKTILFDMGGTLEDIWYNDQTIRTVTGELRTFLDEHDLGTGCNDITFWNKLNSGIRTYKQWSESNELEKKPEEIWPEYYMADFNLNRERLQEVAERLAGMWEVTYYHRELRPKVKETLEELKKRGYHLGVISNTASLYSVFDVLEQYGIRDYFEDVTLSSVTGYRKPHPCPLRVYLVPEPKWLCFCCKYRDLSHISAFWLSRTFQGHPAHSFHFRLAAPRSTPVVPAQKQEMPQQTTPPAIPPV